MIYFDKCPICGSDFIIGKFINKKSAIFNGNASWIEAICNKSDYSYNKPHILFQIISLYGDKYFEKISLPTYYIEIEIDYINNGSLLTIMPKINFKHDSITSPAHNKLVNTYNKIALNNTLLKPDYPELNSLISKVKSYIIFA